MQFFAYTHFIWPLLLQATVCTQCTVPHCPESNSIHMAPKGQGKAKAKPKPSKAQAADATGNSGSLNCFNIELAQGEKDHANLTYITKVHEALTKIKDHPCFAMIEQSDALSVGEGGSQSPFDLKDFKTAISGPSLSYTAGINLFWCDFLWTATPGVPVRLSAIMNMSETLYKQPCALQDLVIAVESNEVNPLTQKGSLLRVSPEEMTSAFLFAIARDIQNSESNEVLLGWKRSILDTTGTFKLVPTSKDRYWLSLQLRENFTNKHKTVYRTAYQRIFEVGRFIKRLKEVMPAGDVTAATVAKAYNENLVMAPGSTSQVTQNFIDCAITISSKMLNVPQIVQILQEMDEDSTFAEESNPLDSHTKLQELINKCKSNTTNLIWVIQGIWYNLKTKRMLNFSASDIRGSTQTGNRSFVDLLIYKFNIKVIMLKEALAWPESVEWVNGPVTKAVESYRSWYEQEQSKNKVWRAGRAPYEVKWLAFLGDVVFGHTYDSSLRLALKTSKTPAEALHGPGLQDVIDELDEKRKELRASTTIINLFIIPLCVS